MMCFLCLCLFYCFLQGPHQLIWMHGSKTTFRAIVRTTHALYHDLYNHTEFVNHPEMCTIQRHLYSEYQWLWYTKVYGKHLHQFRDSCRGARGTCPLDIISSPLATWVNTSTNRVSPPQMGSGPFHFLEAPLSPLPSLRTISKNEGPMTCCLAVALCPAVMPSFIPSYCVCQGEWVYVGSIVVLALRDQDFHLMFNVYMYTRIVTNKHLLMYLL